jgi:hypothetical protein
MHIVLIEKDGVGNGSQVRQLPPTTPAARAVARAVKRFVRGQSIHRVSTSSPCGICFFSYRNSSILIALRLATCTDTEASPELALRMDMHGAQVPHPPATAMPAHVRANSLEVGLLRIEAIVFVTKYLAHMLQQALGLGKIGDGVPRIKKTMCKTTAMTSKNESSNGLQSLYWHAPATAAQLVSSDILGSQNVRLSTSRRRQCCVQ